MKRLLTALMLLTILVAAIPPVMAKNVDPAPRQFPYFQMNYGVVLRTHRVDIEIDNQVATTRIEQVFYNDSDVMAEGNYVFPLPVGAAVSDLVMWVNGQPIEAQILDAEQARQIYDEIVRQMRDPALLEYVGAGAIQASVFPIQPRSEVRIEIEYGELLQVENGLVHYTYPLRTDQFTRRPVENMSISVSVTSNDPISTIYSPTHPIAIVREGDTMFRAGYESTFIRPETDFELYYALASDEISVNLLTYRESADEDGFFTLIVTPPIDVDESRVIPKDVIVVLDQSGSMYGAKWEQAQAAVQFVLENLNERDRFNVIAFSTGSRIYANELQPPSEMSGAVDWVMGLEALGGTDINLALTQAMGVVDPERSTVILFLTDGVPTEGEVDPAAILDNVETTAPGNVRIFTFGVGDDVDTFLLDQLYQAYRGAGTYVRPGENIEEEVSSLYSKINSPVLTNIQLDFGDLLVEEMFPAAPLPDLFVGTQLVIVGRYRDGGSTTIQLMGELEGEPQTYTYEVDFPENAGGQVFIPRLWATRKIGDLLNSIRLHGENSELVDSIVRLSIRYGIITPYTSFLIQEQDIFTQTGVQEAQRDFDDETGAAFSASSGANAVQAAEQAAGMADAAAPMAAPSALPTMTAAGTPMIAGQSADGMALGGETEEGYSANESGQVMQYAGDHTFVWRDNGWIDTLYNADEMTPTEVVFLSDEYFALLDLDPAIGEFLALGDRVLFVWDGEAYQVVAEAE